MGPQYRAPSPETPPDSVWIVTDEDGDGTADTRIEFATGFNAIQGLAWKGDWLWIANAPEMTRVRDTDGDDIADEYIRVYTDLGNLEHAVHGLQFGPDGKLYFSKGNSKGLTHLPDRIAPKPFRDLWGVEVPPGTPEPEPVAFTAAGYEKNYQDPKDDWGVTGGILRCDDDGSHLEIISRGFRNPWDIAFDDGFHWLGTDNDQTMGDKIFAPFYGSHFGWGHSWSYDWKGDDHLPTAPLSGPLFEGSGAGVIWCGIPGYPEHLRDVFLYSDWLNREIRIHRTHWRGAWRQSDRDNLEILAHAGGGRSMPLSEGRAFDPVDLEMGPDDAIWVTSWGRQYGAHYENGELANEGRIYRIWPFEFSPVTPTRPGGSISNWSVEELITDLGSHLPSWRSNAQEELIRRGGGVVSALLDVLEREDLSTALETWTVWTLGRIDPARSWFDESENQELQSLRLQAFHRQNSEKIIEALDSPEARVRLEAVLALRQSGSFPHTPELIELAAREKDRIVFYATWGALLDLLDSSERKDLLSDERPGVRLAAFLSLLEEDSLTDQEIEVYLKDPHPPVAALAARRLGGKYEFEHRGRPLTATEVTLSSNREEPTVDPFSDIISSSGRAYETGVLRAGQAIYTDRDYHFTEVPAELNGLTFLRTACSDAEATEGVAVRFELRYPATVYLLDDSRASELPEWARDRWNQTTLVVNGTDPQAMNVFEADFPAGPVILGANRDEVHVGKGNYVIAVRPHLLFPDGTVATADTILPLLGNTDPTRGRDLFFSVHGANCASCHQVSGIGNNHAPDLSEIGSRADENVLIEAILHPSADIVEGFSAQSIATKGGDTYSGIVLSETGRGVTMALMGGATTEIRRRDIASREGLPISAMPAGFGAMMSSRQLADLVAWMQSLTREEPESVPDSVFEFRQEENELHLDLDGMRIATYLLKHDQLTRRAFVNVRTPSGKPVTRHFPPRNPEDLDAGYPRESGIIHPVMHPGIWMGFGWIDGTDYWRLQARVEFEGFLEEPSGGPAKASFRTRDRYLDSSGENVVCWQDTRYTFRRTLDGIDLEWEAEFYHPEQDFTFGDQEESGLAFRIASPLRVQGGNGTIINDRGEMNGAGTWGKEFQWIRYEGEIEDTHVALTVVPHPENPRKSWAHSRDYGVVVSNPFPKQPKERREPYTTTLVKKGERFQLGYTLQITESK